MLKREIAGGEVHAVKSADLRLLKIFKFVDKINSMNKSYICRRVICEGNSI